MSYLLNWNVNEASGQTGELPCFTVYVTVTVVSPIELLLVRLKITSLLAALENVTGPGLFIPAMVKFAPEMVLKVTRYEPLVYLASDIVIVAESAVFDLKLVTSAGHSERIAAGAGLEMTTATAGTAHAAPFTSLRRETPLGPACVSMFPL